MGHEKTPHTALTPADIHPNLPKAAHVGSSSVPLGEWVYVIVGHTGKLCGVAPTRHDAVGLIARLHDANDYKPVRMPVGAVPMMDVVHYG